MTLENLHLLRPAWLWALALLLPIAWALHRRGREAGRWERVCDPHLLRHLLASEPRAASRWPVALFAIGWTAACLALAGPAWERLPQATFKEPARTVFVLGLGDSMNQQDVRPSRLARARHKLLDALDRTPGGSAALVVYREEAFAVTPLTDDAHVLREAVPLLETRLMPGRSVLPGRGIDEARRLLEPVRLRGARIVLLTDGSDDDPDATETALKAASADGARVSILAVAGDPAPLATLARSGDAAFSALTIDDADLDRVLAGSSESDPTSGAALTQSRVRTDEWNDMGAWLVWIPLALATLAFRRGWAAALLAAAFLQLAPAPAQAGVLDVFQRPDQRGAQSFADGRFAESAQQFEDPAWQAAARYRAGDFAGAAQTLASSADPRSQYNLGNALAKSGQLQEAVAAYDRALAAAPNDEDAKFNRDLVKKLLEQSQSEPKPSPEDGKPQEQSGGSEAQDSAAESKGGASDPKDGPSDAKDGASNAKNGADAKEGSKDGAAPPQSASTDPKDGPDAGSKGAGQESAANPAQQPNATQPDKGDGAEPDEADVGEKPGEPSSDGHGPATTGARPMTPDEQERAQWMARLPDDPGGLLREKIRRDYLRKQSARRGEGGS